MVFGASLIDSQGEMVFSMKGPHIVRPPAVLAVTRDRSFRGRMLAHTIAPI